MINKYQIQNFKNHSNSILNLSNLNILTGVNGRGKSSIIQSMLILRESFMRKSSMEELTLDGDSFSVGNSASLVNKHVSSEQNLLKISLEEDCGTLDFSYTYPMDDVNYLERSEDGTVYDTVTMKKLSLFNDDFQYLSAFRMGPAHSYNSNAAVVDKHKQISKELGKGEFVVHFLSRFGGDNIPIDTLKYEGIESLKLYDQVQAWMGEISDGLQLKINQNGDKYEILYGYYIEGETTEYHSAYNTGYGISYILSVVVAILSASRNSLIIIENPEAHIHPAGQASLMRLITLAASQGVQIILETHSDHIINGALVNLKQLGLNKDLLSVYYFDRDEKLNAKPIQLKVAENGRIKGAPRGFFDQMSMDLEVLFDL